MKIIKLLVLLFSLTATAQTPLKKAVCEECIAEQNPVACSTGKLHKGIENLFTPSITSFIYSTSGQHFTLSYVLILDENGKMIAEDSKVYCTMQAVKVSVIDYFKNLPAFVIPDHIKNKKDKRSLYYDDIAFVFNETEGKYEIVNAETIKQLGIVFNFKNTGTRPYHKKCEDVINKSACTGNIIQDIIRKKLRLPKLDDGVYKFFIGYIVNEDGEIEEITCDDPRFAEEAQRIMSKINLIPGSIQGIPVRAQYFIPVIISVKTTN